MAGRSIFDPQVPAGAYDEFVVEAAPVSTVIDGYWTGLAQRSFQVN